MDFDTPNDLFEHDRWVSSSRRREGNLFVGRWPLEWYHRARWSIAASAGDKRAFQFPAGCDGDRPLPHPGPPLDDSQIFTAQRHRTISPGGFLARCPMSPCTRRTAQRQQQSGADCAT